MSSEKTEQEAMELYSVSNIPNYLTEEEKKINDDYEWCLHDPEVRRQYGNQVVVAHRRRIWGAGPNHDVAWNAASQQPGCPPRYFCAFVVVPPLVSSSSTQSTTVSSSTIVSSPLNEHEKQINDDYEWCLHDPEVRRQYGGQVVAVHRRRIWGAGANHSAAVDAALQQPGCPPKYFLALPVVPPLVPSVSDSSESET